MRFDEFLNERKYLLNVSLKTLVYYNCAFKTWEKHSGDGQPVTWIKNLLDSGVKPVSVNSAMNAYWMWSGECNLITKAGNTSAISRKKRKSSPHSPRSTSSASAISNRRTRICREQR
jgi:hypothetical protein